MSDERARLDTEESRRLGRMKAGLVVTALGGMSVAIGAMSQQDAIGEARMPGLWLMLGGVLGALAGAIIAWLHRPGEAARRLDALGGRIDRAQRARTQQLTLFPISALIFSSLGVLTVGRLQDGEALGLTDWLMMSLAPLYAWVVAAIVMGWDGGSRKLKRYLDDEFSRVLRGRAIVFAFFVLLAGATGVYGLGLFQPELAVRLMPMVLGVAGASAGLRFAWLDRKADQDG